MLGFLSILFLSVAIMHYGITWYKRKWILPPGPRGIPILGNLHQIAKNTPLKFSQWAEQYGKLYTVHFGNKPALAVNDATLIRQIFGLPAGTGSYKSSLMELVYQGYYGIFNSNGLVHQEQRNFFMKTLKARYNKKAGIETIILEEMEDLSEWVEAQMRAEGVVYFNKRFKMSSGNIMWSVAVGERQDTIIAELMEDWIRCLNRVTKTGVVLFSWIGYLAPKISGYADFVVASTRIKEFVNKYFKDPLRTEGDHDDVITAYINHVKSTTDKESSFYGEVGLKHSFANVIALLMAGTETSATAMTWLIFYLAAHPDVQRKMQTEIDEIIGEDREPSLGKRNRMPYTQAVIEETLRMSSLGPFGLLHVLQEDISFLQYKLPKGILLIPNIYHVHNDSKVWGDPDKFRPERFLEAETDPKSESNLKMNTDLKENVVMFQPGKRACPGEPLARDVIFLAATKLLRRFRFSPEKGRSKEEYLEAVVGYLRLPKQLGIVTTVRQ